MSPTDNNNYIYDTYLRPYMCITFRSDATVGMFLLRYAPLGALGCWGETWSIKNKYMQLIIATTKNNSFYKRIKPMLAAWVELSPTSTSVADSWGVWDTIWGEIDAFVPDDTGHWGCNKIVGGDDGVCEVRVCNERLLLQPSVMK